MEDAVTTCRICNDDRLSILLKAGAELQLATTETQALQIIADAIRDTGWDAVAVNLFDQQWAIIDAAYAGMSDQRIADLRSRRVDPYTRAEMFGPQRDRYRISRSYFIPATESERAVLSTSVMPGGRKPHPEDSWHPLDMAYVPMLDHAGQVIGRITIDDPADGQQPDELTFRYIELFADLAVRTIENMRLRARYEAVANALRRSEQHHRALIENAPVCIHEISPDEQLIAVNRAGARMLGVQDVDSILNVPAFDFINEDDRARIRRLFHEALQGQASDFEFTILTKNGPRLFASNFIPLCNEQGQITHVMGMSEDLTDRRRAEEDLRQKEIRYRTLFESSPDGIVIIDPETTRPVEFNESFRSMVGYSSAELANLRIIDLDHEATPESVRERFRYAQSHGGQDFETQVRRKDGSVVDIAVKLRAMHLAGRNYLHAITRDISRRKRNEAQLQQTTQLQQLLLQELDHRVKNALGGLMTMIDMCESRESTVPDFAAAMRSRLHGMATVHNLLSESRWQSISLQRLIRVLVPGEFHQRLQISGPEVRIPARQSTAIGSVLQELVANSMKHGALRVPEGRLSVRWQVEPDDESAGRLLLCWIESGLRLDGATPDSGLGMQLIEGFARFELRGRVQKHFSPEGLCVELTAQLDPDSRQEDGRPAAGTRNADRETMPYGA